MPSQPMSPVTWKTLHFHKFLYRIPLGICLHSRAAKQKWPIQMMLKGRSFQVTNIEVLLNTFLWHFCMSTLGCVVCHVPVHIKFSVNIQ